MRNLALIFLACAVYAAAIASPAAAAAVRISQIYPSASPSSGAYDADYVELFNSSGSPVDLSGWLLASGGKNPTSSFGCAGCTNTFPAGVTIAPCSYLLVEIGPEVLSGNPLPAPDLTFPTVTFTGTTGSLGLLSGGAPSGLCLSGPQLQDLVGWGSTCSMGAAAPGATSHQALVRLAEGMTQTGNNASDFALAPPVPRNSSSPQSPICVQTPTRTSSWGTLKSVYR